MFCQVKVIWNEIYEIRSLPEEFSIIECELPIFLLVMLEKKADETKQYVTKIKQKQCNKTGNRHLFLEHSWQK
jgi:hypothetical protein